jgi:hypothetical protein
MIIKSTKHVDLPDGSYRGFWCEWTVTIPTVDKNDVDVDLEFPVSRAYILNEALPVNINVRDNSFTFEIDVV